VGIFPSDAAITRLVGAGLLEQHEHRQLEGRCNPQAEQTASANNTSTIGRTT
jgi:hypothetical protein